MDLVAGDGTALLLLAVKPVCGRKQWALKLLVPMMLFIPSPPLSY